MTRGERPTRRRRIVSRFEQREMARDGRDSRGGSSTDRRTSELGYIGVQIHTVQTPDLEREMMADNGDAGRHRISWPKSDEAFGARRLHRSQHPLFPNGRVAAAIRRFAGHTKQLTPRDLHRAFTGAGLSLGGVGRSFAVSPWCNSICPRQARDPDWSPPSPL